LNQVRHAEAEAPRRSATGRSARSGNDGIREGSPQSIGQNPCGEVLECTRDTPVAEHIPFLELFGEHVKRALDSAEFTAELRRQSVELADSNLRLHRSLQELERTQAQLVQAQKLEALGRIASGIAHDFNNLLTVIVTHAHLIQPALGSHSEAQADLEVVVDAAMRAAEITQRLLAFSRKQESPQGAVDLNAVTIELSRAMNRWIGDGIVVELNLDPSVGRVRADAADLEQILLNLVANASDAMPTGGQLTLTTRHASSDDDPGGPPEAAAQMIALVVRDSGTGMDDETRRRAFEPFFTTKPIGKGSGLGLSTAYGLVTKNEGRIYVSSRVGEGTRFTILLPSADGISGADLHAPARATRGNVLVVEDEPAIRRMVCRVLRKANFDVIEAVNGEEALRVAHRLPSLDLLVTDVAMPTMSGPELAKKLRELAPRLRVVFMSGYTFDHLDVSALNTSNEHFLRKPFTPNQLQGAVETAFTGSNAAHMRQPFQLADDRAVPEEG
jgi:signal transduction histidine kinase/CheY-like chemotaxis protein